MQRSFGLMLLLSIITPTLHANNQLLLAKPEPIPLQFLIGGSLHTGKGDHQERHADHKVKNNLNSKTLNTHFGFIWPNNNRLLLGIERTQLNQSGYFLYPQQKTTNKMDIHGLRVDGEWVFLSGLLQPYIGIGAGYYRSKDLEPTANKTLDGFAAQAALGIKINAAQYLEFDLRLQHQGIFWNQTTIKYGGITPDTVYTPTSNHTSLGIGLAVHF